MQTTQVTSPESAITNRFEVIPFMTQAYQALSCNARPFCKGAKEKCSERKSARRRPRTERSTEPYRADETGEGKSVRLGGSDLEAQD